MHTHLGKGPESAISLKAHTDKGSTPCKACSLGVVPTLYAESFQIASVDALPTFFEEYVGSDVPLAASGSSLGRAPPAK